MEIGHHRNPSDCFCSAVYMRLRPPKAQPTHLPTRHRARRADLRYSSGQLAAGVRQKDVRDVREIHMSRGRIPNWIRWGGGVWLAILAPPYSPPFVPVPFFLLSATPAFLTS